LAINEWNAIPEREIDDPDSVRDRDSGVDHE
jgi:hypothetical protein